MRLFRLRLRFLPIILSILSVIAFAGPASTAMAQPADPGSLPGTQWQLVSYGAPGAETPVIEGSTITLEFPAANQVAGHAGCNQYSGGYGVEQDDIVFNDIVSTLMACADEDISAQEQTYLEALRTATSYAQTEEELHLWFDNEQQRLVFVSASSNPLLNTSWNLVSYGTPDDQTPVIEGSSVTIAFPSNIRVEGNGGCNGYGGSYTVDGDTITFTEVVSTLMACAEDDVTQQEADYFTALNAAASYEIAGNQLIITTSDGQELHFASTNPLLNTEWQLVSYGEPGAETPVVEGSNVTLAFRPDNFVEGNGGCNGFGGTYRIDGSNLTISEIVSTMMACTDDAVTQQESTYFLALQAATRFETTGGELTIFFGEGAEQLNFVNVAHEADILEGSAWVLVSYGDPANPTPVVEEGTATLNFESETEITGNTGCNGFGGSYQTSGTGITFSNIIQTEIACEGVMEQEQAYIEALLSATEYEGTFDRLIITYPGGELNFVIIPSEPTALSTEEMATEAATEEATPEVTATEEA
jgi:heat shock protein HslJ